MGTSPDLLMIFLGGWAKYSLESKEFDNNIAGSLAGIESVIVFYVQNKDLLPKDKHIEKYIKMKNKGTLKDYIKKNAQVWVSWVEKYERICKFDVYKQVVFNYKNVQHQ